MPRRGCLSLETARLLTRCLPEQIGAVAKNRDVPDFIGAPDTIRTCDLCLRRATLYPAELRVRRGSFSRLAGPRQRPCRGRLGEEQGPAPVAAEDCRLECRRTAAVNRQTYLFGIEPLPPSEPVDRDVRLLQNLTDGPLMAARPLRRRRRVGVAADPIMIDEKYRVVIPHVMILDHGHVAIVQHQPGSIEPGRDNGVIFFPDVVPHDDNPKVVRGNPRLLQSNELCNRVIFAVPGTLGERVEGRTPDVLDTVKCQIAHRPYGQIDGAVDLAESRTTVQISPAFHNGQKLKSCLRLTRRAV